MHTVLISIEEADAVRKAEEVLSSGGVVVFPTDTVYGLGAVYSCPEAVLKLYSAKQRPGDRAIPILGSDMDMLAAVTTGFNAATRKLAEAFWPGPLTLLVPRSPEVPDEISPYPTVAVRVPDLDFTRRLLAHTGPLAVTSANLSGGESPRTADEAFAALSGRVNLVLDGGRTPGGTASTVVDCTGDVPDVLREGPVSLEEIRRVLGEIMP